MSTKEEENFEIDRQKLTAMKFRILQLEKKNAKTRALTNNDMVDSIRKIIAEEYNKNIN